MNYHNLYFFNKIKYPLVFFTIILKNKDKIDDNVLSFLLRLFFRIFHHKILNYDIKKLFKSIKKSHPISYNCIKCNQLLIKTNISNFKNLIPYSKKINKKLLDSPFINQITYWENKIQIINAINDSSFGDGFILKLILVNKNHILFEHELIQRIILIKKTLGYKFFIKNNISLFTVEEFNMFDFKIKIQIFIKLLKKIKNIIENDLKLLKKTYNDYKLLMMFYTPDYNYNNKSNHNNLFLYSNMDNNTNIDTEKNITEHFIDSATLYDVENDSENNTSEDKPQQNQEEFTEEENDIQNEETNEENVIEKTEEEKKQDEENVIEKTEEEKKHDEENVIEKTEEEKKQEERRRLNNRRLLLIRRR